MFHFLSSLLLSLSLLLGGHATQPTLGASSATPVQTSPSTLSGAGITSTATTINLTSFTLPDPNKSPVYMSMLGSVGYAVLEPQTSKVENISFTGITQNTNGSAVLTGVSRGLSFYSPYAASTTLSIAHSGGAQLILSNSAAFYGQQFAFVNNANTWYGVNTFSSTSPPRYDEMAAQYTGNYIATTSEFASVGYVNAVAVSGAPNATVSVKGISQLATAAQAASSTALGSTGASLVISTVNSTDTPQASCNGSVSAVGAGCNIIADLTGHLKQAWLDLTANFTFTGAISIAASVAKNLTLNSIAYVFPSSQQTGTLQNDGAGNLSWGTSWVQLFSTTTQQAMKYATTSWNGTYTNIRIIYNQPTVSANIGNTHFFFNIDGLGSTDYGNSISTLFGNIGNSSVSASQFFSIDGTGAATTSPLYATIDIINTPAKVKVAHWSASEYAGATQAPVVITGAGQWNNTSNSIATTTFYQDGAAGIPSGTTIEGFGSN